jgi:hypothetical protein
MWKSISETNIKNVRLQILTAESMKMIAFLDITLCSLVEVDRRFRDAYCLYHYGDESYFWNVGILQRDYTPLYTRKLSSSGIWTWNVSRKQQFNKYIASQTDETMKRN